MPLGAVDHAFAGNPLDRAGERRADPAWIADQLSHPDASAVSFWNGRPLIDPASGTLARLPLPVSADPEQLVLLGLDPSGRPLWAVDHEGEAPPELPGRFSDLRRTAPDLPPAEAGIAAAARSLFEWRRSHRFCANCGHGSEVADGGWKRVCPACAVQHFPRTDPVVIMLALHDGRCLLGRQAAWPPGRFSALAGFLEPGETIEEGCARELKEEAGLTAVSVRYHSSQPWPWPSQLMIGLFAEVAAGEAQPDGREIQEVRWFTREGARELLAGRLPGVAAPPPLAIAHQLLKAWAD